MSWHARTLPGALAALVAGAAAAQPHPIDLFELRVNAYTSSLQSSPEVAAAPDGSFVLAWSSMGSMGDDASLTSAQVRRFRPDGMPRDPVEFQANTYTTSWQSPRAVGWTPGGGFVVTWSSGSSPGGDPSLSVQARRFAADGQPLDPVELQVNTVTLHTQNAPDLALDAAGNFVIAWISDDPPQGPDATVVRARRFAADGTPLDAQDFRVDTESLGSDGKPAVSCAAGGDFVVVWYSTAAAAGDTSDSTIRARRFAADGTPLDPEEVQINAFTTGAQRSPDVAAGPQGGFVVVWQSYGSPHGDDSYTSIQARRFAADGTPLEPVEFEVNTYTTHRQEEPAVGVADDGEFVVVWLSTGSAADTSDRTVVGRRFAADGAPIDSADFQVNTYWPGDQRYVELDVEPDGDFVVAWSSAAVPGDPFWSIQARRFADLFADGFASGDTSRWDQTVPARR